MALEKDLTKPTLSEYKATLGTDEVLIGNEKVTYAEILPDDTIKEYVEPTICFTKWNKEESLTLSYPDTQFSDKTLVDGELQLSAGKESFYFRQHDSDTLKFGLILNEQGKTNTWTFKLSRNSALVQIKRPPLIKDNGNGTKTFSSDGGVEEHENSQKFYRTVSTLKTIYGQEVIVRELEHGLTFLRPRFIDAKGDWIWADLEIKGEDYIVTVDQKWLEKAVYPVRANDSVTYQEGTDSYTGCIDGQIREQADPDTNYQTGTTEEITNYSSGNRVNTIIKFDLSALAGSTISAVSISLYQNDSTAGGGGDTISCYRLLRNWNTTQFTWNIYSTGNSWSTAGAAYNNNDRSSTVSASLLLNSTAEYKAWTDAQLVTDVQNFIDTTWSNYGWVFAQTSALYAGNWHTMRSANHATTNTRPKITITYTAGGGGGGIGCDLTEKFIMFD